MHLIGYDTEDEIAYEASPIALHGTFSRAHHRRRGERRSNDSGLTSANTHVRSPGRQSRVGDAAPPALVRKRT